jgi:hypothetical protein
MFGKGYLSGVVIKLSQRQSPLGHQDPSFFGTMCNGEAHGDFERRMMTADSKRLNSAFAIASLVGSRQRALANTGGWLPV